MKYHTISILFISLLLSCSTIEKKRNIASVEDNNELSCTKAFNNFTLRLLSAKRRAHRFYSQKNKERGLVHLDLGGEGRYLDAINVNPSPYTFTTGDSGRAIPYWVEGRSDQIPFPDNSIDKVSVENSPISDKSIKEMLRVLKARGEVHLSHPSDYAEAKHQQVIDSFPDSKITQKRYDLNTITVIEFQY